MRAFVDFIDAENDSGDGTHLTSFDLTGTGADARLIWVAYNDSTPSFTDGANINSYTTDATHYITVTAAGAHQMSRAV